MCGSCCVSRPGPVEQEPDATCSTAIGAKIRNVQGSFNDVSLTLKKIMNVPTFFQNLNSINVNDMSACRYPLICVSKCKLGLVQDVEGKCKSEEG